MTAPENSTPAKPCVMIVDDDETIQKYIRATLEEEGYEVVVASTGAVALELLAVYKPDLILLDMYMPDVDGWSFLAAYPQIVSQPAPIVAMSSDVDVRRMPGVRAGLAKPFTIDGLMNVIKRLLPDQARTDAGV